MKTYTFTKKNINPATTIINKKSSSNSNTNYSKILDDLIYADLIEKNPYLNSSGTTASTHSTGDIYLDKIIGIDGTKKYYFDDAIKFIKATKKNNFPYILGKTYELSDGTPIIFFEDSIQIGFDLYYYDEITTPIFLKKITPSLKKKIAEIYISGLKISIYK